MKLVSVSTVRVMLPALFVCVVLVLASALALTSSAFRVPAPGPALAAQHGAQRGDTGAPSPSTPYSNVIVVAKSGGDYTSIQKALSSITDNSATNRYLIWVAPGIYRETVTMKPYVDIEGAGENVTKITSDGNPPANLTTLTTASDAELRYLTIENTGSSYAVRAIYIYGTSPSFQHVTVAVSNGLAATSSTSAFNISGGSAILRNVTALASGSSNVYGILGGDASLTITDSVITASSGSSNSFDNGIALYASSATIWNSMVSAIGSGSNYAITTSANSGSYSLTIDNSTLVGSTSTIDSTHCCYVTRVGASKLVGGPVLWEGNPIICAGVYDENYAFFPNTCP